MTFRQNISRFVIGDISLRSLPDIALQALEQNLDSPSLRMLAGLSDNENDLVIERYFIGTLKELSIDLPDERQAAIEFGVAIAEEIFEGKQNVFEGVQNIKRKAIDTYPFFEETKNYCYDSISFEKVYGLFDTIDDLRNAGSTQWQSDKTNQELENELTKDLFVELSVWIKLMQNGS